MDHYTPILLHDKPYFSLGYYIGFKYHGKRKTKLLRFMFKVKESIMEQQRIYRVNIHEFNLIFKSDNIIATNFILFFKILNYIVIFFYLHFYVEKNKIKQFNDNFIIINFF